MRQIFQKLLLNTWLASVLFFKVKKHPILEALLFQNPPQSYNTYNCNKNKKLKFCQKYTDLLVWKGMNDKAVQNNYSKILHTKSTHCCEAP